MANFYEMALQRGVEPPDPAPTLAHPYTANVNTLVKSPAVAQGASPVRSLSPETVSDRSTAARAGAGVANNGELSAWARGLSLATHRGTA
jgi:hypothetical protein